MQTSRAMLGNKNLRYYKKQQQGVALIIVLLLMALMTTVATVMTNRMLSIFNRTESLIRYEQAYWYALSVEGLASYAIQESIGTDDTVTLSQPWAVRDQVYPLDFGEAVGSVYDEQACFNLNALASLANDQSGTNPYEVVILQRIIESQDIDPNTAELIAASTWEFLDADTSVQTSLGVEDSGYENLQFPYNVPNGLLADETEWRAVYGVTQNIYNKVSPLLCALPTTELKININTLTVEDAPILSAIFDPYLSVEQAEQLIENREPINGYESTDDVMAQSELSQIPTVERSNFQKYIDVRSIYFELDTEISMDTTKLRMRALLEKNNDGVVVLRRRFGGVSERVPDNKTE